MVGNKKNGIWKDMVEKTHGKFDRGMKQVWVGIQETMRNHAGKTDDEIAVMRAQNGQMARGSKGKREVLVGHNRMLGTPRTSTELDTDFEKEINA